MVEHFSHAAHIFSDENSMTINTLGDCNGEFSLLLKWLPSCIMYATLFYRLDSVKPSAMRVTLPVYLNATRAQLLFTVDFETTGEGSGKDHSFYERGVAIISSNLG